MIKTLWCILAVVAASSSIVQGFVEPQVIRFSYRYNVCTRSNPQCNAISSGAFPNKNEVTEARKYLRYTPQIQKTALYAGDGDSIMERVKDLVAEQLGVDRSKIQPESDFMKDLEADSLDTVELVMGMEEKFGVSIPDTEATKIKTVQQAVDFITANQK